MLNAAGRPRRGRHARGPSLASDADEFVVPPGYPTSVMYIDESGAKGTGSRFFVIAAVKTRRPGDIARSIHAVRQRHQFTNEFKFTNVTNGALPAYRGLVDVLATSDAHLSAYVIDKERHDPFPGKPLWEAQAIAASQLIVGSTNRRELVTALMDGVSTPEGIALDEQVRERVNRRFKNTSVVSAVCLDSRATDGLQAADLVASAIAYERHAWAGRSKQSPTDRRTPKAQLARYLREAFGLSSFDDYRDDRVNILTSLANSRALKAVR